MGRTAHNSVESLEVAIRQACSNIREDFIVNVCGAVRGRLEANIQAKGAPLDASRRPVNRSTLFFNVLSCILNTCQCHFMLDGYSVELWKVVEKNIVLVLQILSLVNRQYSLIEAFLCTGIYASAKVHTKIWFSILTLLREKTNESFDASGSILPAAPGIR